MIKNKYIKNFLLVVFFLSLGLIITYPLSELTHRQSFDENYFGPCAERADSLCGLRTYKTGFPFPYIDYDEKPNHVFEASLRKNINTEIFVVDVVINSIVLFGLFTLLKRVLHHAHTRH